MNIKQTIIPNTIVLKHHVNRYTLLGLLIALGSIFIACAIVSYQLVGSVNLAGMIAAQTTNPAIWILNLTPFMFAYWGQAFCEGLVSRAKTLINDQTKEFLNISGDLALKLRYETQHDSLTQLPNARMLNEQITQAVSQLGTNIELLLVVIRVNEFANINYNFGTFNANLVIKQFAEKLSSILVEPYMLQSSFGMSTVARLQGEEFALLIKLKNDFIIEEFLTNLHQMLLCNFMIDGMNINVSTTAGAANYIQQQSEGDGILLSHANIALHHAKMQGLPYMIYNSEMDEDFTQNRIMMTELKRSIENDELEIYFQPTVELATGAIVGAESLVRFEHPQYGLLSAEKFIPLIEGTTLIHKLTEFMLKGVIKQLASWHGAGHKIFAYVNLSNQDITNRKLPAFIKKLLLEHEIEPAYLKLEFTERACLTEQYITKDVLEQLSKVGVKLSVDDFCSGYSSFIYLLNFPINDIKIEKSFVLNMMKDPRKDKIVQAIIKLTETLKLEAVAEGVVDEATQIRLKELGCIYGQGFHFSRAVDATRFKELLDNKMPQNRELMSHLSDADQQAAAL